MKENIQEFHWPAGNLLRVIRKSKRKILLQKLNSWIRKNCAYLGEVLWSTDTCWHPLHRVQITSHRTCSFQCSLLNSRTGSRLERRWQTDHIRIISSSGRRHTSAKAADIAKLLQLLYRYGKNPFNILGSAWSGWQTKFNRLVWYIRV